MRWHAFNRFVSPFVRLLQLWSISTRNAIGCIILTKMQCKGHFIHRLYFDFNIQCAIFRIVYTFIHTFLHFSFFSQTAYGNLTLNTQTKTTCMTFTAFWNIYHKIAFTCAYGCYLLYYLKWFACWFYISPVHFPRTWCEHIAHRCLFACLLASKRKSMAIQKWAVTVFLCLYHIFLTK